MGKRGGSLALGLAVALATGGAFARLRLDERAGRREVFREMLYVPGGNAMTLAAAGYEAPLAGYWWLGSLMYFSDNFRAAGRNVAEARFRYLFQLFDIVTDLSPRFSRAYIVGSQFLTSNNDPVRLEQGIRLLEKGARIQQADFNAGKPWRPDNRWEFHTRLAYVFDVQIQGTAIARGDRATAGWARRRALEEYGRAASLPGCDQLVMAAYEAYRSVSLEEANPAARFELAAALLARQVEDLTRSGRAELAGEYRRRLKDAVERLRAVREAEELEQRLTAAANEWRRRTGRPVTDLWAFIDRAAVRAADPLDGNPLFMPSGDDFFPLPDGRVRGVNLALLEEQALVNVIDDRSTTFFIAHRRSPENLGELVSAGLLEKIPQHPFAALGTRFAVDPETGMARVEDMPVYAPLPAPKDWPDAAPPDDFRTRAPLPGRTRGRGAK